MALQTPVAFLIFNRPDLTQRVFDAIAAQRPRRLLVVADGPRHESEAILCERTREIIAQVDWPCEVSTDFSAVNLGCKGRVSSGLDWVFSQVEEAIILEDDCLPSPSFFAFCEAMLNKYRAEERIMHIGGANFQNGFQRTPYSYYFSRYAHVWGWASWRRAWQFYDVAMTSWPQRKKAVLAPLSITSERRHWQVVLEAVRAGSIDTWDCQWLYACWERNSLSIVPEVNLVSNLGFRPDATHTKHLDTRAQLPFAMLDDLRHPPQIERQVEADNHTSTQFRLSLRARASHLKAQLKRKIHGSNTRCQAVQSTHYEQ
jgi:hypothetical protein